MTVQQMAEVGAKERIALPINPSVARAAGIQFHTRRSPPTKAPDKCFFHGTSRINKWNKPNQPPKVAPGVSDDEVERRTGFPTEGTMLSYIFTVCNGDADITAAMSSKEEFLLNAVVGWARTNCGEVM